MRFFGAILITIIVCECKTSDLTNEEETDYIHDNNETAKNDDNCTASLTHLKIAPYTSSEELKVTWEPQPLENCNFQYRIKIAEAAQTNGSFQSLSINTTFHVFKDLKPCTKYNVTVEMFQYDNATNVLANLSGIFETDDIAFNEIEKLNISTTTDTIRLSWRPHKYADICKIRYIITANKEIPYFRYVNRTEHWIKNLHSCTEYNVSVTPSSALRSDFDNKIAHLMHTVTTLPERVRNLNLQLHNGSTRISWIPPDNNKCIKEYRIKKINRTTFKKTNGTFLDINENLFCTEVGIEVVTINNRLGAAAHILKPGPVNDLDGLPSDASITVSWKPPTKEDCVANYSVQLSGRKSKATTHTLHYTFNEVTACTEYEINVAARSVDGMLGEYTHISRTTFEPQDIGQVENLNSVIKDNLVIVTWEPPLNAGACAVTYIVQVNDDKGNEIYYNTTTETFHEIDVTFWIGCMEYVISITATTLSSQSKPVESNQTFPKVTNPPNCKEIEVGKTSAVLQCDLDDYETNKCTIEEIVINCEASELDDNRSWIKWKAENSKIIEDDPSRPSVNVTVEDLSEFTYYTCNAVVINGAGNSSTSEPVKFQTLEGVPGAPTIYEITSTNRSLCIKWTEPENVPGKLLNYNLTIKSHGPQYFTPNEEECPFRGKKIYTYNVTDTEFNFQGAFPSYEYEVYIKARTAAGDGPDSETCNRLTLAGIPEEPRNVNFSINQAATEDYNVSVSLTWKFPCYTNGDVRHFEVSVLGTPYADKDKHQYRIKENIEFNEPNDNLDYEYTIEDLQPAFDYTVNIRIVPTEDLNSNQATLIFHSPETYPQAPILKPISEVTKDSFTLEWNEPTEKNGILQNYTITIVNEGPQYWVPTDKACFKDNKNSSFSIIPEKTSFVFKNGIPCHKYKSSIIASTSIGNGPISEMMSIETSESEPEAVRDIRVDLTEQQTDEYNVHVNCFFKYPCDTYGALQQFTTILLGNRTNSTDEKRMNFTYKKDEYEFSWELLAEHTYILTVQVETKSGKTELSDTQFTSPSGVPPVVTKTITAPTPHGSTQANFTFDCNLFDEKYGEILYYALILGEEKSKYGFWKGTDETWPLIDDVSDEKHMKPYQATPNLWNPFKGDVCWCMFILGDASNSESNKPLQEGIMYTFKIRGFTKHGYRDSSTLTFEIPTAINVALIVGLIFGILGTGMLLGFIFILWRKRKQWLSQYYKLRCNDNEHDFRHMKKESIKSIPLTPLPVAIKQFPQYYDELKSNSDKLKQEFMLLGNHSSEVIIPSYDGLLPENKKKNRYTNITPYDQTRVKLMDTNDNYSISDYINASYIQGYSGVIEYIATQGPLEHTCVDFWKMVIQENSTLIVMVAQFVEQNKDKCYKYFPNNHENIELDNGIAIRCCTELNFKTHVVRTLLVQKDLQQWTVTHLQFTDWPDFGCPTGTEVILEFCQIMREHAEKSPDPIIIHCSAGVGRTGTLIALDIILQAINRKRDIDIFGTVLNLRRDRKSMVQTEKQYLYIHDCISDALENPAPIQSDISKQPIYENIVDIKKEDSDNNIEESKF